MSLHLFRDHKLQQKLYSLPWVHKSEGLYNSQYPLDYTLHLDRPSIAFLSLTTCYTEPWDSLDGAESGMHFGEANMLLLIMTLLMNVGREHQCLDD